MNNITFLDIPFWTSFKLRAITYARDKFRYLKNQGL